MPLTLLACAPVHRHSLHVRFHPPHLATHAPIKLITLPVPQTVPRFPPQSYACTSAPSPPPSTYSHHPPPSLLPPPTIPSPPLYHPVFIALDSPHSPSSTHHPPLKLVHPINAVADAPSCFPLPMADSEIVFWCHCQVCARGFLRGCSMVSRRTLTRHTARTRRT